MVVRRRIRDFAIALLIAGLPAFAASGQTAGPAVLVADGLGKGTVALDGPWQFHLGDNQDWASTTINDATGQGGWEQLTADKSWGDQGHASYTGYAWYRRHLRLKPAPGAPPDFAMLIPHVDDAYEIFWNGVLVGKNGRLPPNPLYYFVQPAQLFGLGQARVGVLAVRVWKAPLLSFDSGIQGGFTAVPLVGSPGAIADRKANDDYGWLRSRQYTFGLDSLYGLVMILSLLIWLRDRSQRLLLWLSLYCLAPLLALFLIELRLPLSYNFALGWLQPVIGLTDVSLSFLLIWLLRLGEYPRLVTLAKLLAIINFTANLLDGLMTMLDWSSPSVAHWVQLADGILTVITTLSQIFPFVLVIFGFRRRLDSGRWLVAIFAFLTTGLVDLRIALEQGSRFTHWTFGERIVMPLFTVNGNRFSLITIADTGLLLSIIYAVYRYTREASQRQGAIEQELRSAQELQQVLIPDALPSLPGYSVTSAYRPAQEVGGDFFQVVPVHADAQEPGGATLLVLGDVSGKGLRAAMTVSLIVGTLRTLAEFSPQPADILSGLNRRLHGRLHGGFATCIALLLHPDGSCVLANAGHPSPFLNQREVEMPGALPLGIVANATYEELTLQLHEGDHFMLYTDGLLEARTPTGELFSFERLQTLIDDRPSAEQATQAAAAFGQEDDITVLTLTRLSVGEKSSTLLSAPVLAPA